jgi:hypothetical protein
MSTITKSVFGSSGRSGTSVGPLVTLASAMALVLVFLALSATRALNTEHHGTTTPVTGGKTLLELDSDAAGALSDAGVDVGATVGPTGSSASPVFALPIVRDRVDKDVQN